jgi:hypothetical protein
MLTWIANRKLQGASRVDRRAEKSFGSQDSTLEHLFISAYLSDFIEAPIKSIENASELRYDRLLPSKGNSEVSVRARSTGAVAESTKARPSAYPGSGGLRCGYSHVAWGDVQPQSERNTGTST